MSWKIKDKIGGDVFNWFFYSVMLFAMVMGINREVELAKIYQVAQQHPEFAYQYFGNVLNKADMMQKLSLMPLSSIGGLKIYIWEYFSLLLMWIGLPFVFIYYVAKISWGYIFKPKVEQIPIKTEETIVN